MSSESLEQRISMNLSHRERSEGTIDIYVGRTAVLYTPPPLDPNLLTGYDIRPLERVDLSPKPWEMPEPWKPEPIKSFELERPSYLEPIKPSEPLGLLSGESFQHGYSLEDGYKIDFHGTNENTLTHGHVKRFGVDEPIKEFNGYESSILDSLLDGKFKRF